MTADAFRKVALSFHGAVESAHMHHPDFRVGDKIFATLGYPNREWAMVKLDVERQKQLMHSAPDVFRPAKGAWGRRGCTNVHLPGAKASQVREAVAEAWRNVCTPLNTAAQRRGYTRRERV